MRLGDSKKIWRGAGLLLAVVLIFWQWSAWQAKTTSGVLERLDAVLYDWRFQALPPQRQDLLPIIIIDLDEATQQREGRWPWDRAKIADLILALRAHGAQLIGFDVVFSEPVANPVDRLLEDATLPDSLAHELAQRRAQFDGDATLALELDPMVVLGFFLHADGASAGVLPAPLLSLEPAEAARSSLLALPDYTASLALLANSGASSGFVVAIPDPDGIMRRVPLVLRHDQDVYISLTLEMARLALGVAWVQLQQEEQSGQNLLTAIKLGRQLEIPIDGSGSLLVPYKGLAGSYTTISATKVLRGDATAEQLQALQNSIVLVGTSALGLSDLRSTPLQTGYPGVETHANVLDAILQAALGEHTLYLQPDWAFGAILLLMALLGAALAWWLPGRSPRIMTIAICATLALSLGSNAWLWHSQHLALPLAAPLLMIISLAVINISGGYFAANRQRHAIQNLFGEYVPPEHVARMVEQSMLPGAAGELREMTVLFADVRNFTATSEHLSATELKSILNRYLTAVTEAIFESQGTIDKYVGDMVMAFWNAPLDDPKHASHAIAAALAMQERLHDLRAQFRAEGLPELRMGIGLNSGPMNVGDMGSSFRRAYTVLGDAVNLGSRLEGLTSFYQVPILVSDSVRAQAPEYLYRLVDRVRVKGRAQVLDISQPMAPIEGASDDLQAQARRFEHAVACYQLRQWPAAQREFQAIMTDYPSDQHLCTIYLQRMAQADPANLAADWQPVHDHLSK